MFKRKIKCPKCAKIKFWKTADERLKCKYCKKMFVIKNNPCGIPNKLLKQIVSEFILEHSANIILARVKISKYKLLKTLTLLRTAMTKDYRKYLMERLRLTKHILADNGRINGLE